MTKPLMTSPTRADRIEALDGIVGRLAQASAAPKRRVGREQERVAVGRRLGRRLGADHAAGAAAVLDHELLAEGLGELVGPGTADRVRGAARRIGQDELDRCARASSGPAPRPRLETAGGQRCPGQRQELATTHEDLPGCRFCLQDARLRRCRQFTPGTPPRAPCARWAARRTAAAATASSRKRQRQRPLQEHPAGRRATAAWRGACRPPSCGPRRKPSSSGAGSHSSFMSR